MQKTDDQLMSLKNFLAMEKLGIGIITVTSVLVLFLGAIVIATLFSGNPYAKLVEPEQKAERAPAAALIPSVAAFVGSKSVTQGRDTEVVDLICFNGTGSVAVTSDARQVRLRGSLCGQTTALPEVVNRTNGFAATVFETRPHRLSSDYIHLAEGPNQILISYTDAGGTQRVAEVVISRTLKP